MTNSDEIEREVGGYVKKAIVKHIRLNPNCSTRSIQLAIYGPNEWNWPSMKGVQVHICQLNRRLRLHQYKIVNDSKRPACYRLVSLKGTQLVTPNLPTRLP